MSPAAVPSGLSLLDPAFERWDLTPDGTPFTTPSSLLAPVRRADGTPAMLKRALVAEEERGNRVMVWWSEAAGRAGPETGTGPGAAAVLEHDDAIILLERATGTRSLAAMAEADGDADEMATRILCRTISRLHAISRPVPYGLSHGLPTLAEWFRDLLVHGEQRGGFCARAAADARVLLAEQRESVVLHGDVHHGNVLDFGDARWLAIDPKGIVGDPIFDYLNLFCNPTSRVAERPGRLARQLSVVADATVYDADTLLRWLIAWCALSATWFELDSRPADHVLAVGAEAERLRGRPRFHTDSRPRPPRDLI
ncbi:aminoglycoside phosphotransferase family protein [Leifsonia sp. YAF41]|uniref:aminoglycoside phosphotransferase family protein n=1 Tax=Leifsonia sp. YAF41 TaxID=3233086 RepID=UPI003F9E5AB3